MTEITEDGITITRVFDAPRELVFEARITPPHFGRWFGGPQAEVPVETISMDVRPGGRWSATMFAGPDRREIQWKGEFVEVDPPSRLVLTMTDEATEGEALTVTFADLDGKTEMVFHQGGGNLDREQYEQAKAGWMAFFDELAAIVER